MTYRAKHGDCQVPTRFPEDPRLGTWVSDQRCKRHRYRKKDGVLTPEQIERLDAVGFVWVVKNGGWEHMFKRLEDFKVQHGHCGVPWSCQSDPQLGNWAMAQRLSAGGQLTEQCHQRLRRLEYVGFFRNKIVAGSEQQQNGC